jgi:transcriptional antiterminator NusG
MAEEKAKIFALRTTANREDQVMDFLTSHATRKGYNIYSVLLPHNIRGYVLVEASDMAEAEKAAYGIPYARGILKDEIDFHEIEHMVEIVKKEANIQKNDIVEIVLGPFKREKAKIIRIDKTKDEVIVQLLEAAVAIPITLKMDNVRVIRREGEESEEDSSD